MNSNVLFQLAATLVLLVIGILLINPAHFWMPSMAHMAVLAGTAAVFGALAVFVLAEGAGDEREESHKMLAGRSAFLAGGTALIVGIIAEGMHGDPDPWLVFTLMLMVVAKIAARLWSSRYR